MSQSRRTLEDFERDMAERRQKVEDKPQQAEADRTDTPVATVDKAQKRRKKSRKTNSKFDN